MSIDSRLQSEVEVVTIGETMASLVHEVGADHYLRMYAGAESNVAVALSRLGHGVRWISRLGTDPLGDYICNELREEGVEVVVERDPIRPTGLMLKERAGGETTVRYYRSGSAAVALDHNGLEHLGGARWLHLTGVTLAISQQCLATAHHFVDAARRRDIRVSFDVNYRARMWNDTHLAREELLAMAQRADLVFVGDDEAGFLVGAERPTEFADKAGLGVSQHLVFKQGPLGATHWHDRVAQHEPALATEVVDLVGAGDAFAAGFLSGLLRDAPVVSSLRLGHLLASRALQAVGDLGTAVSRAEVLATLSQPSEDRR